VAGQQNDAILQQAKDEQELRKQAEAARDREIQANLEIQARDRKIQELEIDLKESRSRMVSFDPCHRLAANFNSIGFY
jgi:predicted RNase H-like nuclease (RuvC/YqgF family)